jgi:hypothetical protein
LLLSVLQITFANAVASLRNAERGAAPEDDAAKSIDSLIDQISAAQPALFQRAALSGAHVDSTTFHRVVLLCNMLGCALSDDVVASTKLFLIALGAVEQAGSTIAPDIASVATAYGSFVFKDGDGDTIEFKIQDGHLAEYVNGKLELEVVKRLRWDQASRELTDTGGTIPVPRGVNVTALKGLCNNSRGPQCKWVEVEVEVESESEDEVERVAPKPVKPPRKCCRMLGVANGRTGFEASTRLGWASDGTLKTKK